MVRSFHYAAYTGLVQQTEMGMIGPERFPEMEVWARSWYDWVSAAFLRSYVETAGEASFLPQEPDELQVFLDAFLLEKAVYELSYELNNRPDWVRVPLQGILHLVSPEE